MTTKTLVARSAALRSDAERVIRAILPRPRRSSAMPQVLAALALATAGAVVALLLAPHNGAETRTWAQQSFAKLRRKTRAVARQVSDAAERGRRTEIAR